MKDRVTRLHPSGFTVVEIVIVIAVIGILAGFAVPNFLAWLPGYQLKSAARNLQGDLQRARFESIQRGNAVAVVFVPGAGNAGRYDIMVGANSIKEVRMPSRVTLQVGPTITYNSRGLLNNLAVVDVDLTNNQGTLARISTNPSGRVRILRSVGGGPIQNWD